MAKESRNIEFVFELVGLAIGGLGRGVILNLGIVFILNVIGGGSGGSKLM
ncbi:MAG: hypothetical protein MUC31_07280 [Bacteroidales bacterium]|nr:hypothetical protein [Bacteroidales bacterium]